MMIALHKNTCTTPAIRFEIAASTDSVVALAQRYGISEETARKWKKRTSVHDAFHTPHPSANHPLARPGTCGGLAQTNPVTAPG